MSNMPEKSGMDAEKRRLMVQIKAMPDVRQDKVDRAKDMIAKCKLVTPKRIKGTVKRMVEEDAVYI